MFDDIVTIGKRTEDGTVIWIVEESGQVDVTTLGKLLDGDKKAVVNRIAYCTVLFPPSLGGLTEQGTLKGAVDFDPECSVGYDVADQWFEDKEKTIHRRIRIQSDDPKPLPPKGMRLIRTIDLDPDADEDQSREPTGRRYWHWYSKPLAADDDLTKTSLAPTKWDRHTNDVAENTRGIVAALKLPDDLQKALGRRRKAARFGEATRSLAAEHRQSQSEGLACQVGQRSRHRQAVEAAQYLP